jgi:hypothetical protein
MRLKSRVAYSWIGRIAYINLSDFPLARHTMGKTAFCFPFDYHNTHRCESSTPFRIGDTNRKMMKLLICNSGRSPAKGQQSQALSIHSLTHWPQQVEITDYQFLYHT